MSNEFLNGLQAASNAVAGNVAGPVDILSFLLRKAGMPVPENPIGGSNWMTQKGLMAPVRQGASQVIGETAGLLGPAMVSQFGPQIARGLLKGGENLAAPRTLNPQTGAVVYHGSPHKFDKFDSSKIGTGEGAQAYGHGLYLADSEKVADSYRYVHGGGAPTVDSVSIGDKVISGLSAPSRHGLGLTPARAAAEIPGLTREQAQALSILEGAKGDATKALGIAANKGNNRLYAAVEEMAPKFKVLEMAGPDTHLYKVDLPDEKIARMLDWDAPLSQQAPEVRAAMAHKSAAYTGPEYTADELINAMLEGRTLPSRQIAQEQISSLSQALGMFREKNMLQKPPTGEQVYRALADQYGHDKAASLLREAGIPGIRYLDGSSRTAGQGTRNYVVFPGEESSLRILERNGQGLLGP